MVFGLGPKLNPLRYLDPILLGALALLYGGTLYPYLWWGDGPELLTAAFCNGVAHPTGYPLYLLLVKVFGWMPIGSLAWKGHLFSSICTLVAIGILFRLWPLGKKFSWGPVGWRIGLIAMGVSPSVWGNSILTEVYTLSLLLVVIVVGFSKTFVRRPTLVRFLVISFAAGIAVGHHRLLGLMVPGLALWLASAFHDSNRRLLWFAPGAAFFLFGLLGPYGLIYMRAAADPMLNWENASTLDGFWKLFSAHQFTTDQQLVRILGGASFSTDPLITDLKDNLGLLLVFSAVGCGFVGLQRPRLLIAGLIAWSLPIVFISQYSVADAATLFLLPNFLLGLVAAFGLGKCLGWAGERSRPALAGLVVLSVVFLVYRVTTFPQPEGKLAELPERYARRALDATSPGSVLFAVPATYRDAVDYTYYPLLYQHQVAHRNKSVALISEGYFTSPWYRGTLAAQGLPVDLFEVLESGNEEVPLKELDLETYLKDEAPEVSERRDRGERVLGIYRVGDRHYLAGPETLSKLLADHLIAKLPDRTFYFTQPLHGLEGFMRGAIDWTETLHLPMITRGFSPLDGKPIPSGKLFRMDLRRLPDHEQE